MAISAKIRIMVIDDNVANLNIARMALEEMYDVVLIPSGEKALSLMGKVVPDLILLDVEMPGLTGFDVIKQLKESPNPISEIPVIFVTAKDDNNSEFEGLNLGAVDYITKPFSFPLLQKRVELHLSLIKQQQQLQDYSNNLEMMVEEKTRVIKELQYAIVHVLSDMVERRDGSTGGHLVRTQNYLRVLLKAVRDENLYADELAGIDFDEFVQASQLHDVGKMSIPDHILLKPGKLSKEEFEEMKKHTTIGEDAITYAMSSVQEKKFLSIASSFAGAHHERWDGTGYPKGLKGLEIPIEGRLMAIADVYDALISERPYKKPFPHPRAVEIILEESGTHFDPALIEVFKTVANVFGEIADEELAKDESREMVMES